MGTCQEVRKGDLVFCLFDVPETPRTVGLSRHDGMITGAYTILECPDADRATYLDLFYRAMDDRKLLSPLYSGLRNTIPPSRLLGTKTPMPPRDELSAIVQFLSNADARIRRNIRARQRLIALLLEQKRTIIHGAVTKGVDAGVTLRATGMQGRETVPVHWKFRRGKFVFHCVDERSRSGSEELLTVSSRDGVVPRAGREITMFMAASYAGHKLCWPEDLVINSLWAWANGLGFSRKHGIVSTAYGVYRLRKPYKDMWQYLDLALRSGAYDWEFQVRSKGIWKSRLQLTDWAFLDMPVLLPPPDEAQRIVAWVAEATSEIDATIRTTERRINLLSEYRKTLLGHVVTGGVDVREAASRLPEVLEEDDLNLADIAGIEEEDSEDPTVNLEETEA
jgi:type I restriction enzyme S subunit